MRRTSYVPSRFRRPIGMLLLLAAVSACGATAPQEHVFSGSTALTDQEPETSVGGSDAMTSGYRRLHADYGFPYSTIADWATYGDVFAVVKVVDARPAPISEADRGRSEGVLIGRLVTVEVEPPTWTRSAGTTPPSKFVFETMGWVLEDGKEVPAVFNNAPWIEVGQRYAGLFARFEEGWRLLASDTIAAVAGDVLSVPRADPEQDFQPGPAMRVMSGLTADEVGKLLDAEPVDQRLDGLTPLERADALGTATFG